MSRSILKQLGQIVIGGYPWLAEGATKQVGINALTANILCGRHNSVLSVLDTDAGRFFEKVENTRLDMNRRSLSTKPTISYFSGENLERWMLKVFCGLFYAKVAAAQEGRLIDSYTFNRPLLFRAMLANVWEPGCGLYFNGEVGRTTQLARSIAAAPLLGAGSTVAVGIQMKFAGLRMLTLFDPAFSNSEKLRSEGWLHRVSELKFNIQRRSHLLVLTWPPGTPAQAIHSKAFSALRVKLSDEFR